MTSKTIVAPSTPHGIGGIAVVRLSGPQSKEILRKLINNNRLARDIKSRSATFFNIYDHSGQLIDETVITFFQSPGSYTGEDVVEVSCHGNPLIVEKVVSTCVARGAELAEPGEFTRRAFVNGKLDLVQAEAIASLIHAKSEESSSLNLKLVSGVLSKKISAIQEQLIKAASLIEFELDISEEELQPNVIAQVTTISNDVTKKISALLKSYKQARLLNRGALVVIAGEPNVGKSTLLNALTETERAITSIVPGTTRDAIDVPLLLDGVPINLVDTAGLRATKEEIESEGVRRTHDYIKKADLVLLVQDVSALKNERPYISKSSNTIIVNNKIDLLKTKTVKTTVYTGENAQNVSAITGAGLDLLKKRIKSSLGISPSISNTVSITTARQYGALKKCHENVLAIQALLESNPDPFELISIELRDALDNIGAILGKTTPDDILNNIFNQFCVGK